MFERRKRAKASPTAPTLESLKLAFENIVATEQSFFEGITDSVDVRELIDSRLALVSAVLCDAESMTQRLAELSDRPSYGHSTVSYEAGMEAAQITESLKGLRRSLRMAQEALDLEAVAKTTLMVSTPATATFEPSTGRLSSLEGERLSATQLKEWDRWVQTEPRRFLMTTAHSSDVRDHAIAYARYHTSEIENEAQRAEIMNAFADRVVELAT